MKNWQLSVVLLIGSLLRGGAAEPKAPHWAFQPVRNPAVPAVADTAWCRTPLDRFILARLEADGLRPAPAADRRTLIRRSTFDLTGLPPTAEEIDTFVADPSPDAFAKLVDRLLDSPHYGERWGRHWLDVVRYADTAGETADYPVPVAWRYRNYVIAAFNADKPYDEFLREQLAGDILAKRGPRERYAERITATGYLAISRRFGFDSENYHHLTIQDTIDTVGQSVLGLTLGCARCHSHKFDPVPMADYYALYGIFESTRYAFPGSEQKQKSRALVPLLPPEESRPQWREFENRVAGLMKTLERHKKPVPSAVLRSLDELDGDLEMQAPAAGGSKGVLVPPWVYDGPIAVTTEAQSPFKNLYPLGKVGASVAAGTNGYRITQALPSSHPVGDEVTSLSPTRGAASQERSGQTKVDQRLLTSSPTGAGKRASGRLFASVDFRISVADANASAPHRFWLGAAGGTPVVEVLLTGDAATLRHRDWSQSIGSLRPGEWHQLQLTLDLDAGTVAGRIGRPGDVSEFMPVALKGPRDRGVAAFGLDSSGPAGAARPAIAFDNLSAQESPLPPVSTAPSVIAASSDGPDAAEAEQARKELETLLVEGPFALAYAVSEGTPRDARIQLRGEPDKPGDEVPRGFLQVLGGGPLAKETTGSGRLELAEWLTSPANPLTARVMVNRIWQQHFGQGLVRTPNDFGTRGQPPTHPELLDHLATEFMRGGWSIKALHRLIMASAVYQQRSQCSVFSDQSSVAGSADDCPVIPGTTRTGQLNTDPLISDHSSPFSPFTRRRLGAEETRDALLFASGALDRSAGHGHPFPAPTGWGYTQHGPFSAVYDHDRRSVYLMAQRIKRHPFLALFDGADPNASTAERRTTTVPTQALFFLNDPFVHASAEKFAVRVLACGDSEPQRIAAAYRLALGRIPTQAESAESSEFLAACRAELNNAQQEDAETAARAAWGAFARVLFGSNEFLTVD